MTFSWITNIYLIFLSFFKRDSLQFFDSILELSICSLKCVTRPRREVLRGPYTNHANDKWLSSLSPPVPGHVFRTSCHLLRLLVPKLRIHPCLEKFKRLLCCYFQLCPRETWTPLPRRMDRVSYAIFSCFCCCCCCCWVASVVSDSVRPHRRQPTRLPCPWDSLGKNIGVGCHFLLQCMKVKTDNEDAQS